MKYLISILLILILTSCKKDEIIVPDFIDGVPDARYAGIWYESGNTQVNYQFSEVNNKGSYYLRTGVNTGGLIIAYTFYWRKSSINGKFEIKRDFGNQDWTEFKLEYIDTKNIKIEDKVFIK